MCCTFSNSLRSDTSISVRLAMSLTSCWILGEYSLGDPSRWGVAMAPTGLTELVLSVRWAHGAVLCTLCLWNHTIKRVYEPGNICPQSLLAKNNMQLLNLKQWQNKFKKSSLHLLSKCIAIIYWILSLVFKQQMVLHSCMQ